jgi:hypothetical protein
VYVIRPKFSCLYKRKGILNKVTLYQIYLKIFKGKQRVARGSSLLGDELTIGEVWLAAVLFGGSAN